MSMLERDRVIPWLRGAISAAVVVTGCGGGAKPVEAPAAQPQTSGAKVAPEAKSADGSAPAERADAPAPPKVRLLSPGAAPRQKLRYRFAVGPSEWMQMDMKMSIGVGLANTPPKPVQVPTIRSWMRLDPKSVNATGDLRYEFETSKMVLLTDAPMDAPTRAKVEQDLSKLAGLKGYAVVTPRGITKEADFAIPPDAPESMQETLENIRTSLRQMCSPLPEEEVGKGAMWEVQTDLVTPALHLTQTATQTLRELRPQGIATTMSVVQVAPRQPMKLKKLAGAKAELESMLSTGDGKTEVALDKLVGNSFVRLSTNLQMTVTAPDESAVKMSMTMGIETTLQPGKAP